MRIGSGLRLECTGVRVRVEGLRVRVEGLGSRVWGLGVTGGRCGYVDTEVAQINV
jgi:hypothetical protein